MAEDRISSTIAREEDRLWTRRLRIFSGKSSVPANELDHDAWKFQVEDLISQTELPEPCQRRLILQSLSQPALGLVRSLGKTPTVEQILQVIDVVYGPVVDGHNLLVKFHGSLQTSDESTGGFLQRLQRLLRRVIDAGMLPGDEEYENLRDQFCRGSHDEVTIQALCLESSPDRFDDFCELLAAIHNAERKRRDKAIRLGRQDNPSSRNKTKATAQAGVCMHDGTDHVGTTHGGTTTYPEIGKVLADALETQTKAIMQGINALGGNTCQGYTSQHKTEAKLHDEMEPRQQSSRGKNSKQTHQRKRPTRSYFCYKCGLNGHMKAQCSNPPNAQLVYERLQQYGDGEKRFQNVTSTTGHGPATCPGN